MNRSVWVITMMGFITVIIIVVAMLLSLTMFQKSPASNRAKLAQQLQNEFGFPAASSEVSDALGRTVLVVVYESHVDSKFDLGVQKAEMEKVAAFVEKTYDGADRRHVQEIRVQRREFRTRGCWARTLDSHHVLPNPRFPGPAGERNPRLGVPAPPDPGRR